MNGIRRCRRQPERGTDRRSRSPSVVSGTIMPSTPTPIKQCEANAANVISSAVSISSDSNGGSASQTRTNSGNPQPNFTHPAFADIGRKLKACNDTLGALQQLGIQHVVELPELVLVGDQSSGKSSLMSAIAHLNLPRSSGICTRCPFHIRMSSSNSSHWSCAVSLLQDYDYRPPNRRVKETDVTKKNPLPPWHEKQVRDTKVFKTIYERDSTEVEDVLRWAQIATLNPGRNHEQYIPGEGAYAKEHSLEDAKNNVEARFSPNIVALEMKGPGLTDLSFYDLPGIFANAEYKEDDYLVKVVKNLTLSYVCRPEAIIMLALPIDVDKENSMTMKTIRDADAEARTIGVITKADRLVPEKSDAWLDILQGKKETVGHGCFVTSLPPDEELNSLARWEESFFHQGTSVWPDAFIGFGHRCGVKQLEQYLTKQLGDAFSRRMPSIKKDLEDTLFAVEEDLNDLPELPDNVEHIVRMSLQDFYRRVKAAVTNSEFEFRWKDLNIKFHDIIVNMKPPCAGLIEHRAADLIEIHGSDSDISVPASSKRHAPNDHTIYASPATKRSRQEAGSPSVKRETGSSTMDIFVSPSTVSTPLPDHASINIFDGCLKARGPIHVQDIRREIIAKTRAGFAKIVPVEVHETLSLRAIQKWEGPLKIYIEKVMEMLAKSVIQALELSFGDLRRRLIFKESQEHLVKYLDEHEALQRTRLIDLFHNETYKMDTVNEISIENFKVQELLVLERVRTYSRARAASLLDSKRVMQPLEKLSVEERVKEKKILDDCLAKLPEDPYHMEIEVAATVRAYYLTAATRFVDAVIMDVNSRLFREFREGSLDFHLENELGLHPYPSREVYDHLLEEEAITADKRQKLKGKRHKLQEAIESILQVENYPGDTISHDAKHQERVAVFTGAKNEYSNSMY